MEFWEWKEILFLRMELCVCAFKKFITRLNEKKKLVTHGDSNYLIRRV